MINAVLDACVLYPALLRDYLLWLTYYEVFHPYWSEEIRNKWTRSLLRKRPELEEKLARTRRKMEVYFPYSLVQGYETLIPSLQLPDMNDRHVLATAIHANAKYIVTFDLNDFPQLALQPYGIVAISPDDFVLRFVRESPIHIFQATKRHRTEIFRPLMTVSEYHAMLENQGILQTVAFLRNY